MEPDPAAEVACSIGDVRVVLRSELPQVAKDLAELYGSTTDDGLDEERAIHLDVRRAGRSRFGRRLYRVFADGQEIGGCRHANGVFPLLEWGINLRVMETRSEYLQLHAASMVYRGHGVIFAADSGSGKSTLAAILLSRGWQYLCDEFALVRRDTFQLDPFPKALCIKQGSYALVQALDLPVARSRDYLKELKGRVSYIDARRVGTHAIGHVAPVRFVIFPRYRPGQSPHLEPVSRTQATMRLVGSCFNRHTFPRAALDILTRTAAQSRCFELGTQEPQATADLLESRLDAVIDAASASESAHRRPAQAAAPRPAAQDHRGQHLKSRRDLLRIGAKVAYVTPSVLMLAATPAMAAGSNPSGVCSTGLNTGELCETDSDCCSKVCDFGVCQ